MLGFFIGSQAVENRLSQLVVLGPFRELDLANQPWVNPMTTAHFSWGDRLPPTAISFLRQINEWTVFASQRFELMMKFFKRFLGKSAADFGSEMESVVRVI